MEDLDRLREEQDEFEEVGFLDQSLDAGVSNVTNQFECGSF